MNKKHLTYDNRLAIRAGLQKGFKMTQIAKNIDKDRATTSREVKTCRELVSISNGNNYVHHKTYTRIPGHRSACFRGKRQCQTTCGRCQKGCLNYQEEFCSDYEKSPFVRNACDKRLRCRLHHMLYDAKYAQEQYENTLSESWRGISLVEQELNQINDIISPLLKKGQSLPMIYAWYRAELPMTDRTIYSYIDTGLLGARSIDLQRKLRRPERKKDGPVLRVDQRCHTGRIYEDCPTHTTRNPDALVCQMGSAVIHRGGQIILTILLTTCGLRLTFLQERNTTSSATRVLQDLR